MSVKLHLGVIDQPYGNAQAPARRRQTTAKRPVTAASLSRNTTGDVAEILEARYGIMAFFVKEYEEEIGEAISEALRNKVEALEFGAPIDLEAPILTDSDLDLVAELFRKMLDDKKLDGRVTGVPTQAALKGVSHRMQQPYAGRGERPSFIDTGLYQTSFRAWVEDD